jgi:hypothetical protein
MLQSNGSGSDAGQGITLALKNTGDEPLAFAVAPDTRGVLSPGQSKTVYSGSWEQFLHRSSAMAGLALDPYSRKISAKLQFSFTKASKNQQRVVVFAHTQDVLP